MTNESTDKDFYTPADIAELFQISRAKAYALLKRGEIPCIRIGSLVRVRKEQLMEYIREKAEENGFTTKDTKDTKD